jgi:hypothetical protein
LRFAGEDVQKLRGVNLEVEKRVLLDLRGYVEQECDLVEQAYNFSFALQSAHQKD